jgi:cytochrome c
VGAGELSVRLYNECVIYYLHFGQSATFLVNVSLQAGVFDSNWRSNQTSPETSMKSIVFALALGTSPLMCGGALAQDADAGGKVFVKCKACHQIGENAKNMIGPVLTGVVGRPAGTYPGYNYSDANKNSGITWDEATLKVYLKNPRARVPGTKMTFPGLSSDDDINNVIAYLKTFPASAK